MRRVRLIHAKPDEARVRAKVLRAGGYRVIYDPLPNAAAMKIVAADPGDAIIIDLERMPSLGRDFGVFIRQRASTRQVPLVFAGGEPEKVARVRALLPDATYTAWRGVRSALKAALAAPPSAQPVRPRSIMEAYAGRALPAKLGIAAGMRIYLVGAPVGFEASLGKLPKNVLLTRRALLPDLTMWFVTSQAELEGFDGMAARAAQGRMWIAWPKGSDGLSQAIVRKVGLDAGWVDHKICRIDATWAALLFSRRKTTQVR